MPVRPEWRLQIKYFGEIFLDLANALSNADLSASFGLQKLRRGQVVSMRMRFENPFKREILRLDVLDDFLNTGFVSPARNRGVAQHRIDDSGAFCVGITDDIR